MGLGEIQRHQIGVHAELDHAAFGFPMLRPCAADRRHHQRRLRGQRLGIQARALCHQRCRTNLLEHIQIVVRGGRIRAKGDIHARLDHVLDLCTARGKLEIRAGIVDGGHLALSQQTHILRFEPHAMRRNRRRVKNVVAVEHLRGRQPVALLARLVLGFRLGQVDVHPDTLVDRVFAQSVPSAVIRGVFAVNGGFDLDSAVVIAVPFFF